MTVPLGKESPKRDIAQCGERSKRPERNEPPGGTKKE